MLLHTSGIQRRNQKEHWHHFLGIGLISPMTSIGMRLSRSTTVSTANQPMLPEPHHGEIWLVTLDKRRPVVVLTRDPMGSYLHSVLVGPITSTIRGLSTEVQIGQEDGISRKSVVNLDNVQLVARSEFVRHVGNASRQTLALICRAMSTAIDCD